MKRNIVYGWFVVMLLTVATPTVLGRQPGPVRFHVDCDGGGPKLSQAIELAQPGDTIVVRGTCRERVNVTRGPLILDGGGNAVLDGAGVGPNDKEFNGLITVDGAHGVTIRGWLIRNGTGEGILGTHGANMSIENTVVEQNFTGIGLSNSAAEVVDTATRFNSIGLDLQGSTATITGGLSVKNNAVTGIQADNATGLTFASIPPNNSAIQSNGTDVRLSFGTKSTINGVLVGTILCDATVLSRGTTVCP